MFIDFQRKVKGEEKSEGGERRERVRNIDWLPTTCSPDSVT